MKLTENQSKALQTCIQTVITALLLFVQTAFFGGCVATRGDVNQNNDFSVPLYIGGSSNE